jgi:MFS family permease
LAYRALSGVGEALQNAALFAAVGAYFFANRTMALGSLNFAYGVGGFLGPLVGAKLAGTDQWRMPFVVYGLIGLGFCVLIALVIRKAFTERQEVAGDIDRRLDVDHVPVRLYNRNIVMLGAAALVVGMSMYGYIGLYPTFLVTQLHWSSGQAALAASMFGLGALLGIPAGWLGDRLNQRTVMIVSLVAGSVVGYLLFNGPTGATAQYLLSFAEGAIASGFLFVNIYSAMQRAVRPQLIGRASGVYVSAFYIPAAFAGYLFSALVAAAGWGGAAVWQLTVLPLIGVVALLFVDVGKFANARVPARS